MDVKVVLKDGNERLYPQGTRIMDIVSDISERLAKEAIVARLNGRLVDLFTPVEEDSELEVITFDMSEAQEVFRHSTSHIMAQAVMRLFPGAKLAIGPSIKDGF
ncbi:MAG TPA: TGS domain-containing protein, partial [Clostridia bacterium]|nr:TGS domain-containing protein [Clostridia bacterium]